MPGWEWMHTVPVSDGAGYGVLITAAVCLALLVIFDKRP